jgi:hypothetical protein
MKISHWVYLAFITSTISCKNPVEVPNLQAHTRVAADPATVPGLKVAHSPATSQVYIGSPSISFADNGSLVASHDHFGPSSDARTSDNYGITKVYRLNSLGTKWDLISTVPYQFMSNIFMFKKKLYLMGTSKTNGNVVIKRSDDNGYTWTNSSTGTLLVGSYHTAPTPMVEYNGRIWRAMEDTYGNDGTWPRKYRAFMMSASTSSNLLLASSWTKSNVIEANQNWWGGYFVGWMEGNAVLGPGNQMYNVIRNFTFDRKDERVSLIKVNSTGTTASFSDPGDFTLMPGGHKKFTIRYDGTSGKYIALTNYIPKANIDNNTNSSTETVDSYRNVLALCSSTDLKVWKVNEILLSHSDKKKHAFQYVDWVFNGNNISYVSRTAYDDSATTGAADFHNNNYITSHTISGFRSKLNTVIEEYQGYR